MLNPEMEAKLEANGWTVECHSPLEIRHEDGSFATGVAAHVLIDAVNEGWFDDDDDNR